MVMIIGGRRQWYMLSAKHYPNPSLCTAVQQGNELLCSHTDVVDVPSSWLTRQDVLGVKSLPCSIQGNRTK